MHFVTLYIREAHPISGSPLAFSYDAEGNAIEQPETYLERVALAAKTIAEAGITMLVLVDEIDDPVWCTYGRRPNNAYFIGTDGRIVLKQDWNSVAEVEDAILRYLGSEQ
ncbi:MAG: hypothetical protein JSW37_05645 [Anaerolineales bacterium]|nr:MAG: hypothetical protein JSW37_05645 [Anaerolineales bacterium]